jgi:hypothetical protein
MKDFPRHNSVHGLQDLITSSEEQVKAGAGSCKTFYGSNKLERLSLASFSSCG